MIKNKNLTLFIITTILISLFPIAVEAAKMVDVRYQPDVFMRSSPNSPIPFLQSLALLPVSKHNQQQVELKEIKKEVDSRGNTHIRYQQTYRGIPIWGAISIEHIPAGNQLSLNKSNASGTIFQDLSADLNNNLPDQAHVAAAEEHAIQFYKIKVGKEKYLSEHKSHLVVYVDDNHKAHWAVQVDLYFGNGREMADNPNYLIDAVSLEIYKEWNGISFLDKVKGGGLGGNPLLGMNIYDGLPGNKPALDIQRNSATKTCYLQNDYVVIRDGRTVTDNNPDTAVVMSFPCEQTDPSHGNVYWNRAINQVNGAWSPENDALYLVEKVNAMYEEWFQVPVLFSRTISNIPIIIDPDVDYGLGDKPAYRYERMKINVRIHDSIIPGGFNLPIPGNGNAAWDNKRQEIMFGSNDGFWGNESKYPFVVPGVIAHELSHGFTHQHSNLFVLGEPGALNEAFSDMSDAAFEYYLTGKNTWEIAVGLKKDGSGLRYLDDPTKDGKSIDNVQIFYDRKNGRYGKKMKYVDPHLASGIFNKAFYLLSQPKEQGGLGNTKLAFATMVQANQYHWSSFYLKFKEAACGVLDAARELGHRSQDLDAITRAFKQVGLDTSYCHWWQ
jgi:pseudolysin